MPEERFGVWNFGTIFGICSGAVLCFSISKDVKAGIFDSLYFSLFFGDVR